MRCVICESPNPREAGWHETIIREDGVAAEVRRTCSTPCCIILLERLQQTSGARVQRSADEEAKLAVAVEALGEFVTLVGASKPFGSYSRPEVLVMVETIVAAIRQWNIANDESATT
jgi:hypothetical protein